MKQIVGIIVLLIGVIAMLNLLLITFAMLREEHERQKEKRAERERKHLNKKENEYE